MFLFSPLNYDLVQSTPSGSMNIYWNQLAMKAQTNSIMYMTQGFDPSVFTAYPEFGMFGNNLLNPMLAIQQTMQAFQNNTWSQWNNNCNWFNTPWNTNNNNNNGSTSAVTQNEYNALKAVIEKYKALTTDTTEQGQITDALNKSGTTEEKLQALKDLYKKLNKTKLEKALLTLPEYRAELVSKGYMLRDKESQESNKNINSKLRAIDSDLKVGKADSIMSLNNPEPDILQVISLWNDSHTNDNNRGIIRMLANNIPSSSSEIEMHKAGVKLLADSLMEKADELKAELESCPKLDKAILELSDELAKATKDNNSFTKNNVLAVAKKFDNLYAMLRIMEAEKIRNNIITQYAFLNDIDSSDKDFVTDDLVVKSTKADLEKEGISLDNIELDSVHEEEEVEDELDDIDSTCETPEEKVEKLIEKEQLVSTSQEGVYATKNRTATEPARHYMIKDGKLVELKDVKLVDANGNCTMVDGESKNIDDVVVQEVTAQDVVNYNKTVKRINDLISSGKIIKNENQCSNANVIYRSKGKNADGNYQYFVVKDNTLKQIECLSIGADGNISFADGSQKTLSEVLASGNLTEVGDNDILAADVTSKPDESGDSDDNNNKVETLDEQAVRLAKECPTMLGKRFCQDISGYTNDDDFKRMKAYIKAVSSENVVDFLKGYYSESSWYDNGFFEQIAAERGCTRLSNGEVTKVMKSLIDYFKDKDLSTEQKEAYEILQDVYRIYGNKPKDERFANESNSWWYRLWGCDILDKLDDAVELLIKD